MKRTGSPAGVILLALISFLGRPAAGQYTAGDVLLADQFPNPFTFVYSLKGISRQGTMHTVTPLGMWPRSVTPAPNNRSVWVSGGGPSAMVSVTPSGAVTTLSFLHFDTMQVDGGGNMIGASLDKIFHVAPSGTTTLYSGRPFTWIRAGAIDLMTGDLVVVDASGIYRVSLHGQPKISTVVIGIPPTPFFNPGLHDDPETGTLIGVWSSSVFRLTLGSSPALTTLYAGAPLYVAGALDRDPVDGRYIVPNGYDRFGPNHVFRFDARTTTLTTLATLPNPFPPAPGAVYPGAAAIAGSRHLCGGNDARAGQRYSLLISSPNEPGAFYATAASLGFAPGIPAGGGRKIYLNPGPLFQYSMTNAGIFSGMQGNLDGNGEGIATINIPNTPGLSGFRFFVSTTTVVNNRISVISDPLGVTIQ